MIDPDSITSYIMHTFSNVETTDNLGYRFFFYKDDHMVPFATIALNGNEYEKASMLDRPGVYRLNLGVSRDTFQQLFSTNKIETNDYDFTALDTILPHPDYSAQSFICVLSPGETTFETLRPLLKEAYKIAEMKYNRRNDS